MILGIGLGVISGWAIVIYGGHQLYKDRFENLELQNADLLKRLDKHEEFHHAQREICEHFATQIGDLENRITRKSKRLNA